MAMVLLVEDDDVLRDVLRYNFEQAGFAVETASDGLSGLAACRALNPDLIILDVMLPGLDGFSICRMVAREKRAPIVFLTAVRDEAQRVAGLELGAIDYVVKPFSMVELLARARSIVRWSERTRTAMTASISRIGGVRLDRGARRVWLDDRELELSVKEFDLLAFMMTHPGVALSRDMLLEHVWGASFFGSNRTIDVHIRWLREKLEVDPASPTYIRTIRGIGYAFEDPTRLGEPERQVS